MGKSAATDGTQRIPMQAVGDCQTWQMPEVGGKPVVYRTHDTDAEEQTLASRLTPFTGTKAAEPAQQPATRTRLTGGELEQLIASAEAEGRERGHQEGLLAGHAEGMQQGLQAATEQMKALHSTVEEINTGLPAAISVHNNELQNAIVELVGKVASAVVHGELSVNSTALQEIINTALSAVNVPDKAVTVFVSEQDYQSLNDHAAVEASDWQLKVDEALTGGDCRVTTQHASIDYTVAQRLEQAIAALYASLAAGTK
ncbi:MAG: FliH/SctL family protein [Pseudomonadales bacterium]